MRKLILAPVLLATTSLSESSSLLAQQASAADIDSLRAAVGSVVRLRTPTSSGWLRGTLQSVDDMTVTIRSRDSLAHMSIPSIAAADRSTGRDRIGTAAYGMTIGIAVGAFIGYGIGVHAAAHQPPDAAFQGIQGPLGLVVGGAAGGTLGIVVGAWVAPEHWTRLLIRH